MNEAAFFANLVALVVGVLAYLMASEATSRTARIAWSTAAGVFAGPPLLRFLAFVIAS